MLSLGSFAFGQFQQEKQIQPQLEQANRLCEHEVVDAIARTINTTGELKFQINGSSYHLIEYKEQSDLVTTTSTQ